MSEYIDREKIMLKTCSDCTRQVDLVCKRNEPCEKLISAFLCEEKEDVAPVIHGRWGIGGVNPCNNVIGNWKCSLCGGTNGKDSAFCPNCGAKMDLE